MTSEMIKGAVSCDECAASAVSASVRVGMLCCVSCVLLELSGVQRIWRSCSCQYKAAEFSVLPTGMTIVSSSRGLFAAPRVLARHGGGGAEQPRVNVQAARQGRLRPVRTSARQLTNDSLDAVAIVFMLLVRKWY